MSILVPILDEVDPSYTVIIRRLHSFFWGLAFDMDYVSNYHVQTGYLNLYALLDDLELSYSTFLWDPRYKGLDDYIWEYLLRKKRET